MISDKDPNKLAEEWIETTHGEINRLREINRELVENLKSAIQFVYPHSYDKEMIDRMEKVITKAEGKES